MWRGAAGTGFGIPGKGEDPGWILGDAGSSGACHGSGEVRSGRCGDYDEEPGRVLGDAGAPLTVLMSSRGLR
jgi:hypothetical protein